MTNDNAFQNINFIKYIVQLTFTLFDLDVNVFWWLTMLKLLRFKLTLMAELTGILPLYFWIGNPFCWSCYPLRLFITLPAGLGFLVLVLTPCMGIAKYRVMVEAPDLESALSNASDIIFTIGVVFWGIIIVGFLMWKIFNKFVMELCPCLEWCSEEDDKKKKREDEKNTGCWCF